MFSVELTLDESMDRAVRLDWARLDGAGIANAGGNASPSNRPHITLAVRDDLDPSAFSTIGKALPMDIELGGTLLFGHRDRFVLSRMVIATEQLLDLHRRIAAIAGPPGPRYANTSPDHWTPHVTLARRLRADDVAAALAAIEAPPITAPASGLRVWDAATKSVTTLR